MVKIFAVDGMEIACWLNPRDFGSHRQSLLFIHGSGSDHTCWSYQYSHLYKQFNVVAIDLPGHGSSTGNGESDVDAYCLWIKKLLKKLPLARPVLSGHSLGAAIALKFALLYPQDIAGIAPVGGGLKMPVNPDLLEKLKTNPALAIELICKFSLARENRPKLFEPLKNSLSAARAEVYHGDLSACAKLDLTTDIDKIKTRVLVICGLEDKMMPALQSREIAARIPDSELCLIEGAGHMVMMEKPAEVNKALEKFASSIS